jgi:NTP pyrophosphatase (non-canonical NTP hydrolase)
VDSKTYVQEAIKTESYNFNEIKNRLSNPNLQKSLYNTLYLINELGLNLDFYKKFLFYGKGIYNNRDEITHENFNLNTNINEEEIRLLHAVLGIVTEAQEMIDQIMNLWKNNKIDKVNLFEENGDIFWYQAVMADVCGKSFEDLMDKNIEKLRARYGEKFSSEKAINRNLEKERTILENLKK